MFDLEKLAKTCRARNRWTFFVSSAPANVPGKSKLFHAIKILFADTLLVRRRELSHQRKRNFLVPELVE